MSDLAHALPLTGRRTAARVVRAAPIAFLIAGVVAVAVAGHRSGWAALLSAAWPGLGQLVQTRWLVGVPLFLVTLVCVPYAILRAGGYTLMLLGPAAVLDAATHGRWWSIPAGMVAGAAACVVIGQVNLVRRAQHERAFRTAREAAPARPLAAREHLSPLPTAPAPPLDRYSEAYLRFMLRFGSAAPDDWSVFDDPKHADGAIRFQMVLSAWSLFVFQRQYTPAYREAVGQALGNFAERGREFRVWSYTKRINLKAFRLDGDPFARENVMYSGYMADMIGMFEAMTGDHRYDRPGGYSVSDGKRTYEWNHQDIVDTLAVQHATSPLGGITCVPGFIWPVCQTFSMRAIQLGDLLHDTDHGWAVDRAREGLGRFFMSPESRIDFRRHVSGIADPVDAFITGVSGQAGSGAFLSTFERDTMQRNYERWIRPRVLGPDADGAMTLQLSRMDTWDTSYGWNEAMPYSIVLLYAAELGDHEVAAGLRRTLETMLTPDGTRPGPGSITSMAMTFLALIDSEGALGAGHRHAPFRDTSPELESAPYPQVVVTRATTDGEGVTVELTPGPQANGEVELRFARLQPGRSYRLTGVDGPLEADATGRLTAKVESNRRQSLALTRTA